MKDGYEMSNITKKEYRLKDYVAIRDPKQQKLYIKHEVYPVDMYTTLDERTKDDLLVMLFSKTESQPLYVLWKNRELK